MIFINSIKYISSLRICTTLLLISVCLLHNNVISFLPFYTIDPNYFLLNLIVLRYFYMQFWIEICCSYKFTYSDSFLFLKLKNNLWKISKMFILKEETWIFPNKFISYRIKKFEKHTHMYTHTTLATKVFG